MTRAAPAHEVERQSGIRRPEPSHPQKTLDLVDFVKKMTRSIPVAELLDEAPKHIARLFSAEVASLYLLEGSGDQLVMRGNVGFKRGARGRIRLRLGEGITGAVVASGQPVRCEDAASHEAFIGFPELEESEFPRLMAAPVFQGDSPIGAVVVQRRAEPFTQGELELLQALTAPMGVALRGNEVLHDARSKAIARRKTSGGTRRITLTGTPVVQGKCIGGIAALRRPASGSGPSILTHAERVSRLRNSFEVTHNKLGEMVGRAHALGLAAQCSFLESYLLIAEDSRLRSAAYAHVEQGRSVGEALDQVSRDIVRAAAGITGDEFLANRARDIEDFCNAVAMLAVPDPRAELPSKPVLVGEDITVFDILVSAKASPVGIVLSQPESPRARVLLELLAIPAVVDVAGVFQWTSPGDVALVDAEHGLMLINPSRSDIAALRAEKKRRSPSM